MVLHWARPVVYLLSCVTWVSAYYGYDPQHPHRPNVPECPLYECKAGQRPVQKDESKHKVFTLDHCHQEKIAWMTPEYSRYREPLGVCCHMKDVCLGTCGMDVTWCYKKYWKCAEHMCERALYDWGEHKKKSYNNDRLLCEEWAKINDVEQIFHDRRAKDKVADDSHNICTNFAKIQKEACECVPASEFDRSLKKRAEGFFAAHEPQLLNKKKEIKDKKYWQSWKGRRPEMMFELMMRYNGSLEVLSLERKEATKMDGVALPDDYYEDEDEGISKEPENAKTKEEM